MKDSDSSVQKNKNKQNWQGRKTTTTTTKRKRDKERKKRVKKNYIKANIKKVYWLKSYVVCECVCSCKERDWYKHRYVQERTFIYAKWSLL